MNLTARIESYTVGGQIYISEYTYEDSTCDLFVEGRASVTPKGVLDPISIHSLTGVGPPFNLHLPRHDRDELHPLDPPLTECTTCALPPSRSKRNVS